MMDTQLILQSRTVLILVVIVTSSDCLRAHVSNDCGTVSCTQPNILGNLVQCDFTHVHSNPKSIALYIRRKLIKPENTAYQISPLDSWTLDFNITFNATESHNNAKLLIRLNYGHDQYCDTPRLMLKVVRCGTIEATQRSVNAGDTMTITYAPENISAIIQSDVTWQVKNANQWTPVFPRERYSRAYESTFNGGIYRLTISRFGVKDAGSYRVRCGVGDKAVTNAVTVSVLTPPERPLLGPISEIPECADCIAATANSWFYGYCYSNITAASRPVDIIIKHGGRYRKTCDDRSNCTFYKYLYESDHLSTMTCSVKNDAIEEELSTTKRVFVIVPPGPPTLHLPSHISNRTITCAAISRPSANVTLVRIPPENHNEYPISFSLSEANIDNKTTVTVYFERRWNGQQIKCCAEGPHFGTICSNKTLEVAFPPNMVEVTDINKATIGRDKFELNATCEVRGANPACTIRWKLNDSVIREAVPVSQTITGDKVTGFNTTSFVKMKVTSSDDGGQLKCQSVCQQAESKADTFAIDLKGLIEMSTTDVSTERVSLDEESSFPIVWVIVAVSAAIVIAIIVVVVILLLRNKRMVPADDHPGIDNEAELNSDVTYAKINKDNRRINRLASNKGEGVPEESKAKDVTMKEDNQLVYIELDKDHLNASCSDQRRRKVEEQPTEYVGIDFAKTAGLQQGADTGQSACYNEEVEYANQ